MMRLADRVHAATLDNGIRVHLVASHVNPTVDLIGVIEGGMFLEEPASAGVGHLCVTMLDRGTRRRTQAEISDALESNGARLSHGLAREAVTIRARCLTEDLEMLLAILGETLAEPSFPASELELAKEDARAGLREAAFDTCGRAYDRAAGLVIGPEHPYARETLGCLAAIDATRRENLEAFHRAAIVGARTRLVMIGDFEPEPALALLARHLGAVPAGEAVLPPEARPTADRSWMPTHPGSDASGPSAGAVDGPAWAAPLRTRDHVEIADKGQIDAIVMRPGVARTDEAFTAYGLANFILGGSFVSRLNQRLRDQEGLTYGAQSSIISALFSGFWSAYVGVHPRHLERAVAGILEEMRRFATQGVDEEELELARMNLTGSFPIRLETNRAVAAALIEALRLGKGPDFVDTSIERIRAVTGEQVNAAAQALFRTDDAVLVTAGTLAAT
jgi:zinc protease